MYRPLRGFFIEELRFGHILTLSFRWETFTGLIIMAGLVTATITDTCVQMEWFVDTMETVLGSTETWDVTIDH